MDNESKEILKEALKISQSNFYNVRIYETNGIIYTEKRISYLELGIFLNKNTENIRQIRIYTNY